MHCEAVILAGGLGTRLQGVLKDIPKPMADIAGRPFLNHLLDYLRRYAVEHVVLAVGHRRQVIREFFGACYAGVQLTYSEEEKPLGTGGGIKQAFRFIGGPNALILNGDSFFDIDLESFERFHRRSQADISIALKPMKHVTRYGTVQLDSQHRITGFAEKAPCAQGFINGGIYVAQSEFIGRLPHEGKFSFETDVLERYVTQAIVKGCSFDGYFVDIGVPEDLAKAQLDLPKRGRPQP